MNKLLTSLLLLFLSAPAKAVEISDVLVPSALAVGTVLVMRTPALNNRCNKEPCDSLSHIAVGAVASYYVYKNYGILPALFTGIAIGVGKELMDMKFDNKDAAMTIVGSSLTVISLEF
jgi:hypothetical protein